MNIEVKGVQGTISFDGEWITITKTPIGPKPAPVRLRAANVTGSRHKPGSRLFHGYVQFLMPDSQPSAERPSGSWGGGRPSYEDPYSLSIPRRSNEAAVKLIAAVEQAGG